jgi:hypothetical protein
MRMLSSQGIVLIVWLLSGTTSACGVREKQERHLVARRSYTAHLAVTSTGSQPSQLRDSTAVVLSVDSVRRDSVFGTYTANFRQIGVLAGRAGPGPQIFVGRQAESRISLRLTPDATDAGVLLEGVSSNGVLAGTWRTIGHQAAGEFRLNLR